MSLKNKNMEEKRTNLIISPIRKVNILENETSPAIATSPHTSPGSVSSSPTSSSTASSPTTSTTTSSTTTSSSTTSSTASPITREYFRLTRKIAEGSYGVVYKGEVYDPQTDKPGRKIAVKIMTKEDDDDDSVSSIQEIDILSRLHNPYLLNSHRLEQVDLLQVKKGKFPLVPVITGKQHPNVTIAILMPLGISDVEKYIIRKKLTIQQSKTIAWQTAYALQFLHQNRILHMDFKAANVIILSLKPLKVVLCDFGLALYADRNGSRYFKKELITYTYRPPENFKGRYYSTKSDVWSWGIFFLNMLLSVPYIYQTNTGVLNTKTARNYIDRKLNDVDRKKTLHDLLNKVLSNKETSHMVDFLYWVLAYNSDDRPSMDQILDHPLMSGLGSPSVECFNDYPLWPRLKANDIEPGAYSALDYLIRLHKAVKTLASTYFISADLFHRGLVIIPSLTHYFNQKKDMGNKSIWTKTDITSLYALTCFWLSIKLNEVANYSPRNMVEIGSYICSVEALLEMERQIIITMGGILYRKNLYTRANNEYQVLAAFEYSTNIYGYNSDDILYKEELLDPAQLYVKGKLVNREDCYLIAKDIDIIEPPKLSTIYLMSQYNIIMKGNRGKALALLMNKHKKV